MFLGHPLFCVSGISITHYSHNHTLKIGRNSPRHYIPFKKKITTLQGESKKLTCCEINSMWPKFRNKMLMYQSRGQLRLRSHDAGRF